MNVRFNELPASVRARFVQCSQQGAGATFWAHASNMDVVLAWVAMFFGGAALSFLVVQGSAVASALLGALFFAVLAITIVRLALSPPYRAGTFFFPSYIVVARRDGTLSLHPPANAQSFKIVHRRNSGVCHLHFYGAADADSVNFNSVQQAEQALAMYLASVARFQQCIAQRDQGTLSQIDPFWECTVSNQFSENPPSAQGPKATVVARPVVGVVALGAAVIGGVLGVAGAPSPPPSASRPISDNRPVATVAPAPVGAPHERVNSTATAQWLRAALASPAVVSNNNTLAIGLRFVPPPESELTAIEQSFRVRVPPAAFARYRGTIAQEFEGLVRAIVSPSATVSVIDFDYAQTTANATFTISLHARSEGPVARFRRASGVGLVLEYEGVLHIDGVEDLRSPRVSRPSSASETATDLQNAVYTSPDAQLGFYQAQLQRGHRDFVARLRTDWLPR